MAFSYVETSTSAPQVLLKALSKFWLFSYQPESISVACFPENEREERRAVASVTSGEEPKQTFVVLKVRGEKALVQFTQSASLSNNQKIQLDGISDAVIKKARGRKAVIYTKGNQLEPNAVHTAILK